MRTLLLAITFLSLVDQAFSGVMQLNDTSVIGNGPGETQDGFNITRDTTNSLDWLDWTLSTNLSYNDVITQFGAGGTFAGFRHATKSELDALLLSAGTATGFHSPANANLINLQNMLGITALGYKKKGVASNADYGSGTDRFLIEADFSSNQAIHAIGISNPSVGSTIVGHALVRSSLSTSSLAAGTVPEPTSFVTWGMLAIGGMVFRPRRKK